MHAEELGGQTKKSKARFRRVVFNEITKKAILAAFEDPSEVDSKKVDAQQARRVLVGAVAEHHVEELGGAARYGHLDARFEHDFQPDGESVGVLDALAAESQTDQDFGRPSITANIIIIITAIDRVRSYRHPD